MIFYNPDELAKFLLFMNEMSKDDDKKDSFTHEEDNMKYYTIFDLVQELDKDNIAIGKNTELNICKNENNDLVNELGDPIPLTNDVLNDLYFIVDKPNSKREISFEEARELYLNGHEVHLKHGKNVYVIQKNDQFFHQIPENALFEGVWFDGR